LEIDAVSERPAAGDNAEPPIERPPAPAGEARERPTERVPSGTERRARPAGAEARWTTAVVFLAVGLLYQAVSERRTLGLGWVLLALDVALLLAMRAADARGRPALARQLSIATTLFLTTAVTLSTAVLVVQALTSKTEALDLLRDALALWVANVLIFALWYWQIDGGGPDRRAAGAYRSTDFVFPQHAGGAAPADSWAPGLVDYLFLAFTTAMAFSPTDTAVLSQRAKLLVMAQAVISLLSVAVLAARAINGL
jgi:hypothetical protein